MLLGFEMEQFVLVPAAVKNNSFKTQSFTKQELPKFQASQNPTCKIVSLKEEINKKYLCQSRLSGRQIFVLSTKQALNFADFRLGWRTNSNFTVRLCSTINCVKKPRRSGVHFTLLDSAGMSPTLILNLVSKKKRSTVFFRVWTSEAAEAVPIR